MKYLYDTNIFIDYFADEDAIIQWFTEKFLTENQVIISTIVRMELLCFSGLSVEEDKAIMQGHNVEKPKSRLKTHALLNSLEYSDLPLLTPDSLF